MTENNIPEGEVIKIDPDGKYIMIFPMRLTQEEMDRVRDTLDNWLSDANASPILMGDGGVQIVKLELHGEKEGETKTKKG
jgi:hypothetical protein